MWKDNRREFLKKSMLGISGTVLIPRRLKTNLTANASQKDIPDLPNRILGRTGIETPMVSMGTATIGAGNPNFIKAAYLAGIKLFFSATYYSEGSNEKMVGEGLRGLPRDSFVIGTAVTPEELDRRTGRFITPPDIDAYIKQTEASLNRFGFDYVDIVLFPFAGERDAILDKSLIEAFQELKQQGKTRYVGIATHHNCVEAIRAAADSKFYDVVMTSYNYRTPDREAMNEALSYAAKAGLGILAMKTTGGGGFRDGIRTLPVNSDAILKWVLQNENIASLVLGISTYEELQKDINMIYNLKMSDQELEDIKLARSASEFSLYCHQCRTCMPQCPHNLEIPTIMRSYMYAYGYNNMKLARHTLSEAGLSGNPCEKCEVCTVNCNAGFNVKERILDISRLKDIPEEFLKA